MSITDIIKQAAKQGHGLASEQLEPIIAHAIDQAMAAVVEPEPETPNPPPKPVTVKVEELPLPPDKEAAPPPKPATLKPKTAPKKSHVQKRKW